MRTRIIAAIALTAVVLLTASACSSSVQGTPSTTPTVVVTGSEGNDPGMLDGETELWFATYCLATANVTRYYSAADPTAPLSELQTQYVQTYTDIADAAKAGARTLRNSPVPDPALVGDAPALAIDRFTALADVFGRGAQTIEELDPSDTADLKAATTQIQQRAGTAGSKIMAQLDPQVLSAAGKIPECSDVL